MNDWSYLVLGLAYLVHGTILAAVAVYAIGWEWVCRLQLGRYAGLIRASIGATLIWLVVLVVGLQRWIFCHIESYALHREELSTMQVIDQWLIDAYEGSKAGIYKASMYIMQYVWHSNSSIPTAEEVVVQGNATVPVSQIGYNWHWRYRNEAAFCASGEGISGFLFNAMSLPISCLCLIAAFLVLVWWYIHVRTLQWKWRLTVQHIISNLVDVVSAPLILFTIKRLYDCEGTAAELQMTGFFQRDLNDASLSATWGDGCTKTSIRPLLLCLALLTVRGCCRGCALLMEARRVVHAPHVRRQTAAYVWLYPAWLLAWGRVICTGTRTRTRTRTNPLGARMR
jgi:hypothetical protein